jgi:hypothetical protein
MTLSSSKFCFKKVFKNVSAASNTRFSSTLFSVITLISKGEISTLMLNSEGLSVGSTDNVGISVGVEVGCDVGDVVGGKLGNRVGCMVGVLVGNEDGR